MVNTTLPKPSVNADSDTQQGVYLYGILPGNTSLDIDVPGLDKQPIQTHAVDQFVFLYSIAQQERYLASRKNLLGHERVLEHVMSLGCRNVLPLQFGLVIESWDTVYEQLIASHRDSLIELFKKLENRREVSIKVMWDMTAELEMLMQENEELRHERDRLEGKTLSMEEVVAIGQAIEQAMEDRKQDIINAFQSVLDGDAVDV
ncbi:MAG: GvpL/GvpF family gas vesicle protein, partial [Leptolyngbyaceae bacterium]|nr:GvpL/GvpF family gas vesicle protein [Leptolyngbyaceae bacterium]